ncbi:MAG: FeoA family protein [Candidatus Omnitrophota bacterium]
MPEPKAYLIPLDCLQAGECGLIRDYAGHEDVLYRLRELGLVRGTRITVRRFAPLGDPMELRVRGYHLSIRKKDASLLLVEKTACVRGASA